MKKISVWIGKIVCSVAMIMATVCVNTACFYKYYQEELPEEIKKLRKHG